MHQRVVQAVADGSLERLVEDSPPTQGVELLQFGLERRDLLRRPLRDNRRVEAAELRDMEERPCPLERVVGVCGGADPEASRGAPTRALERELPRRVVERRPLEQQAHREVSAQRDREVPRRDAVGSLFDLPHDAGPAPQGEQFRAQIVARTRPPGHRAGPANARSRSSAPPPRPGPRQRCPGACVPSGRSVPPATSGRSRESSHGYPGPFPASTSSRGPDRGNPPGIE